MTTTYRVKLNGERVEAEMPEAEMPEEADNMRHWRPLMVTDPRQTKPADRPGTPRGLLTAIDPAWRMMRLTEHFGPIGIGWGMDRPEWLPPISMGDDVYIQCVLKCWYFDKETGQRAEFYGIGGDTISKRRQNNDEAYKGCFTDALMNAFMRIGLSADIWLKLHQDSKYLASAREAFGNTNRMLQQAQTTPTVIEGGKSPNQP